MTSSNDLPAHPAGPSRTLATGLLTTGTLPATTAGMGVGDPKLPPYVGD